jgi:uncharacterized damage-inducible protein DinB
MTNPYLEKIFEHNHWANLQILDACSALNDEQLDAEPHSATRGNIRLTLLHLVSSQRSYLANLTLPVEARPSGAVPFGELRQSLTASGEGFLTILRGEWSNHEPAMLQMRDGYLVESWVLVVQALNHATEHREQIKSMLTALGIKPPDIDGWTYGEYERAQSGKR